MHTICLALKSTLLAVFAVVLAALLACSSKTPYKTFTMQEGFSHFSFDCPTDCEMTNKYLVPDAGARMTQVILSPPASPGEMGNAIVVTVLEPNPLTPDAQTYLDLTELLYKNQKNMKEFKFVQKYSVTVAGAEADAALYYYTIVDSDSQTTFTVYTRGAYFDAKERVWAINVGAGTKDGSDNKAVFDRLLKTFKILE